MKLMRKGFFAALASLIIAGFVSCSSETDSGNGNGNGNGTSKSVTSVTLNHTTLDLILGLDGYSSGTLTATVTGANLEDSDKGVTWTSSKESVATVTQAGVVTAVGEGTAVITAKSKYNTAKTATCTVVVTGSTVSGTTVWDFSTQPSNIGTSGTSYTSAALAATSGSSATLSVTASDLKWAEGGYLQSGKNSVAYTSYTSKSKATFTLTTTTSSTIAIVMAGSGDTDDTYRWIVVTDSSGNIVGKIESSLNTEQQTLTITDAAAGAYTIYTNGVRIYSITVTGESSGGTVVPPTAIALSENTLSFDLNDENDDGTKTLTYTLTPDNVTSGYDKVTWSTSNSSVAAVSSSGEVTAKKAGTAVITVTTDTGSFEDTCTVTVTGEAANSIKASDTPTGWASYTGTKMFDGTTSNTPADSTMGTSGGYGAPSSKIYTVSTRSDLLAALSGTYKKIIYINGMIDMTDGLLPSSAAGSTTALDSWIKTKVSSLTSTSSYGSVASDVTNLATWKTWYAGGNTNSADESGVYKAARQKLADAYASLIKITVPSNTTIIGLTDESGIKGGCIKISGVSNIVIRNLTIQDPFDPFPQIEDGDGFNANYDGIEISSGSKYIWIDHCTIQDTIATTDSNFDHVTLSDGTSLKYQVFDGLCDIKQASDFITVSYCKFANHDKTSLIGHSASYTSDLDHQTITLHHNYYYNCKQRLPMVRMATIHIYNNLYAAPGGRGNDYCIGLREQNRVYAENNYFDSTVTPTSNSDGNYYFTGNYGKSDTGTAYWNPSDYYSYTADSASGARTDVMENAGAGVWPVKQ